MFQVDFDEASAETSDQEQEYKFFHDPAVYHLSEPSSAPNSCTSSPLNNNEDISLSNNTFLGPLTGGLSSVFNANLKRGPGRPRKEYTGSLPKKDDKLISKKPRAILNKDILRSKIVNKEEKLNLDTNTDLLENMNIDQAVVESIDRSVALVEELPYFPEKFPGKVCILCNLNERSQLGQGEMLRLEIVESDKHCMDAKSEEDSYLCLSESTNNTTSLSQMHNRRIKGLNKAKNILNTSEYIDELEQIGYTEPIEFAKVQDLPFYYVHRFCMTWSFEVQREVNGVLGNTVPVVAQSLKRRCSHCSRYGASIVCKMLCPKFYHLPCIAASGGLQVIQSFTSFCTEHLIQAPNMCAIENIVCRHCSILGELSNLIMCSMCGDHYHGMCIGVKNLPGVRAGWQCKSCSKCQICRVPDTSEGRSLSCEQCHKVYHAHCFRPIMASIPKYGWKCVRCRVCSDCGSRTPGAGSSSRWHSHYTVCDSCYQQRNKGFSCPICHRAYRAASYKEMVKCNWCNKFVHSTCDSEADLLVYHSKKESNPDYDYICPPCKSCDQNLASRKVNQIEEENSANIMETNYSENDNNIYDKSTHFTHGKGKPYAAIKLVKKRFSLTNVNRSKGKFLLKKKARLSEMNRKRGPKSKLKGMFGSGMNLQRSNFDHSSHKMEEEPGIENKLVLCSAKDRYVLTQDICIMCGALGTDEESCLISCTQCGQCYHPYCVSVKITNVILKKGWRCLDCTICEGCGQKNDEARLILCDECDISYHIYCTDPPLDYVPQGNWKCKWCANCQKCGSNSPGKNCLWKNSYSECGPCASQNTCPICSLSYAEGELIIQCSYCSRWLHCKCDSINNEEEAKICNNSDYNCLLCRPKDMPPFHLSTSSTEVKSTKQNTSSNQSFERFNDPLINHSSDISHFIDGVCLSDEGFNCIKLLQTEIKKRRKPKGAFDVAVNKTSGIIAAIESVVSATDNSFDDSKMDIDLKDDVAEIYKDGMVWSKTDASPPQGFTVVTNEQGIALLRKKRQRNLQKLGIGGFNVRNRTIKKESFSKDDNEEAGENFLLNDIDRKRKTKKKIFKNKLIETYPEYLQEAFFGKGLLEFDKGQIFESDSADDENKQNITNDNIFKLSREELKVLETGNFEQQIIEQPLFHQQPSMDINKSTELKVEESDIVEIDHATDVVDNQFILNTNILSGNINHKDINRTNTNSTGHNKNIDLVELKSNYQNKNMNNSFCNNLPSRENINLNLNQLHKNETSTTQTSGALVPEDTNTINTNQQCGSNVENNVQSHGSNHNTNDNNNNSSINNSSNNLHNVNAGTSGNIVDSFKNILNNKFYNYDIVKSSGIKEQEGDILGNSLSNENVTSSLENFSSAVCNDDPLLYPSIDQKSKSLIASNYYDIHQATHINPNDLTSSLEKTYSDQMAAENFNSGGHFNHNLLERDLMTPNENISSTRISEVMDTSFELQNSSPHNMQFEQCYPSLETMGTPPAKAAPKSSERMRKDEDLGEMATISAVLYANTVHPELRHDFPEWNDRCKQICKRWRVLSNEKKAPFLQQAKDNRSALRMNKDQLKMGPQKRNLDGQEKIYNDQQKDKLYLKGTNDLSSAGSSTSAASTMSAIVQQKEFIDIPNQQKSFIINKFNSSDLGTSYELHSDNLNSVRDNSNLLNKPKEEAREDINMYSRENLMSHENAGIGEVNDILGGFAEDDEYELLKSITAEMGDDFNLLEYADPEIDSLTDTSNQNLLDKLDFTDVGEHSKKNKIANNSFLSGQTLRERLESSNPSNINNINYNSVKNINIDDNKSHCDIKPPPPPPYPGLPPPYPVGSDSRQEQPLLLEDLLEEERREKRNEMALNKETNQSVTIYDKMSNPITQATSADYINWNKQPIDHFDSIGNVGSETKVDVKKPVLYQLNLPPRPPSPPLQILTNNDRLKQIKYEEWLTVTNNQLDNQLKYYEDEIAKLRKSRKTLNSKRRSIKKNGGEITQEITSESSQLTSHQAVIQKQLEYARKQIKQHGIFIENYNSKHGKMSNVSPNCQSPTSNISNTSTQSTHQSLSGSSEPYPVTTQSHFSDNIILLNKNTIQSSGSSQNLISINNHSQVAVSPNQTMQQSQIDRLTHQKLEETYGLSDSGISSTTIPNRLLHTSVRVSSPQSKPNNYHMNTYVSSQHNGSQKFINYDHLQLNKITTSPSTDFPNNVFIDNNRMENNEIANMDSSLKIQMHSMDPKLSQCKMNNLSVDQMQGSTMLEKLHYKGHTQSSITTINRPQTSGPNISTTSTQILSNLEPTQPSQMSSSGISNLSEGYFPVTEHFARFGRIKVGLFGGSPINSAILNSSSSKPVKTDLDEKTVPKSDKQKQLSPSNQKPRILDYDDFSEKSVVATEVSLNSAAQNLTDIDDIPVMTTFGSTELSDLVLSSPLESDVAEDYMLFSSHVVDYADSDDSLKNSSYISTKRDIPDHNYPAPTTPSAPSNEMHTYSRKCSEIPPKSFLSETEKEPENGNNTGESINEPATLTIYKNFNDNHSIISKGTSQSKILESSTLPTNIISCNKITTSESSSLINAVQNTTTKPHTVVVKAKKIVSDVTQTTAKVSIGNTTISVPLLKPMAHIITNDKHNKLPTNVNLSKQPTIYVRGQKINPTIVSLSQIKPVNNAKIVQATVIGKKVQLQQTFSESSISTSKANVIHTYSYPNLSQDLALPNKIFEDESTSPKSCSSTHSEIEAEIVEKPQGTMKKLTIQKLSASTASKNLENVPSSALKTDAIEIVSNAEKNSDKINDMNQSSKSSIVNQNKSLTNVLQLSPLSKPTEMATNMANVSQQLKTIMSNLSTSKIECKSNSTNNSHANINMSAGALSVTKLSLIPLSEIDSNKTNETVEQPNITEKTSASHDSLDKQTTPKTSITTFNIVTSNHTSIAPTNVCTLKNSSDSVKQKEQFSLHIKRSKSTDETFEKEVPAQITNTKRHSFELYPPKAEHNEKSFSEANATNKISIKTSNTASKIDDKLVSTKLSHMQTSTFHNQPKSEEAQNVLLKKLLQSSSNENSANMVPSTLTGRNVTSLRAPSLGIVDTLEAQLARPVIPPVPANPPLILTSAKHTSSINTKPSKNYQKSEQVEPTKPKSHFFSKETSFVSSPCITNPTEASTRHENKSNQTEMPKLIDCNVMEITNSDPSQKKIFNENIDVLQPNNTTALVSNLTSTSVTTSPVSTTPTTISKPYTEKLEHSNVNHANKQSDELKIKKNVDSMSMSSCQLGSAHNDLLTTSSPNQSKEDKLKMESDIYNANVELRKKRKREYQKNRRQQLNKDVLHYRKKTKKISHIDEDYDRFIDNLLIQIRQMLSLQVLEPLLNRNYGICPLFGSGDISERIGTKDSSSSETEYLCGEYGSATNESLVDIYNMKPFGTSDISEKIKSDAIQNGFYDQEFTPIKVERETNQIKILHNIFKDKNLETAENIVTSSSPECTDWENLTSYPHIRIVDDSKETNLGSLSPTLPILSPVPKHKYGIHLYINSKHNTKADKVNVSEVKRTNHQNDCIEKESNMTVTLTLTSVAAESIIGVLRALADVLHISAPTTYRVVERTNTPPNQQAVLNKLKGKDNKAASSPIDIQTILNGSAKFCRHCDIVIMESVIHAKSTEFPLLSSNEFTNNTEDLYFCSKICYQQFKWRPTNIIDDNYAQSVKPSFPIKPDKSNESVDGNVHANEEKKCLSDGFLENKPPKLSRYKHYTNGCFNTTNELKKPSEKDVIENLYRMGITVAPSKNKQVDDSRQCVFCRQKGDGVSDGPSRLLNFDVDKWVHLNCALWSDEVYETVNGALMNLNAALQASINQTCSLCHDLGATIKCFKNRCTNVYHLSCALKDNVVFYKNKTTNCSIHASKTEKENILMSLNVLRRVYVERDECGQVASVMHHSELSNLIRVGSLTFLSVGQLLPHQLQAFHTTNYIYPIGYKIIRFYWSMRKPNKRCRYVCSIADSDGVPEFRILVQETEEDDIEFKDISPKAVWQRVLDPIAALRKNFNLVQLFPKFISGEDLFGLTEPSLVRILESLPGIESLTDYRFKYGRNPLLELPLAINPSGSARTEQKQKQAVSFKKPHTQRTGSAYQRIALPPTSTSIAGEVTCPYSKQFVHSKSSQYKKMKQEWRNNVFLARSKIQGLGLYAARDLEKHTMVIEYIGEVIRSEVSEIREKQYQCRNRGIYMFRLDGDRVVDATLCGGLARYINHSCNPNCVTEIVEVDREYRIIIFAKRRISRGEELSYDYKFDIEDDAHKISCMCGAPNCKKWMN